MKIIRNPASKTPVSSEPHQRADDNEVLPGRNTWKILVVDDETDVRTLTRISLKNFSFAGMMLDILEANSAEAARDILSAEQDIAVALIDVVMETDDAGLTLVEYIRGTQNNQLIRLIIRTGQPGVAPEKYVIDHYDIDDYKDKTELTATRLYTSVRSALKAYRDLQALEINRQGLERVLHSAPSLYKLTHADLSSFFNGMLTQIIGLCGLSDKSHIGTLDGLISTIEHNQPVIRALTDNFADRSRLEEIQQQCVQRVLYNQPSETLRFNAEIMPLTIGDQIAGYIYIEPKAILSEIDRNLIQIFARQCSQALENFNLNLNIMSSFDSAIDMLAEIAEYKDKATGGHVNRLDHYTRLIAIKMGINEIEAQTWGKASRLHDVGKVGIPDHILAKPGKLTDEEFEIIKKHTTIGAAILSHDKSFDLARQIALSHHERWDGTGYPEAVKAGDLHLATRIVSVADVFDALISWRPYKSPWSIEKARSIIAENAGTQFDPDVVNAFLEVLDNGDLNQVIEWAESSYEE